jgi:hypothetical protein
MIVAGLVVAVGLAVTPAGASPMVRGFGPYLLGAKANSVLKTGGFRRTTDPSIHGKVDVFVKDISAPLNGEPYPAKVYVYVTNGVVGGVVVKWNGTEFDTVSEWQQVYHGLWNQLVKTYGAIVVGSVSEDDPGDDGMAYVFHDAAGNLVAAGTSTDAHFDITIIYESAAFAAMQKNAPKPTITY